MRGFFNWYIIFSSVGHSLQILAACMFLPAIVACFYEEWGCTLSFLVSAFITFGFGLISIIVARFLSRRSISEEIGVRDAFLTVIILWILLGFIGGLPYLISSSISNPVDAYFETVSGFTTTGASILTDIEILPRSILFWRSMTQWLGGLGILVLIIALLPSVGYGSFKLFVAETPGPTATKVHPKIRATAIHLWVVYIIITAILVVLLMMLKVPFFEAITHAFSALSTGGFSPKNTSIAEYPSAVQYVITFFMFVGGINFVFIYLFLKGKWKQVFRSEELKAFTVFVIACTLVVTFILFVSGYENSIEEAFRIAIFQVISIVTTTGFVTDDYLQWPVAGIIIIFMLNFVGGMIGSTAGGIKFTRHYILLKNARAEVKHFLHPQAIISIRLDKQLLPDDVARNFFIVFISYLLFFIVGALALCFFVDVMEAMSVSISCLSAVGPALGQFGPTGNYAVLHPVAKWICSLLMIIGRLEVVPFLMIFHHMFWRK